MPHLESLRAPAMALVVLIHFGAIPDRYSWIGGIGLRMFFVLSGFLITALLLKARTRAENPDESPGAEVARFFKRRALRLLPVFYLALFAAAAVNVPQVRDALLWHACYASNLYTAKFNDWTGPASHFWSLAVEEQFYLVWAWVILFVPRKRLAMVTIGVFAIGVLFRVGAGWMGLSQLQRGVLLPGCMDSLGAGSLLAIWHTERFITFSRNAGLAGFILPSLAGLFIHFPAGLISAPFLSLIFVWIVARAASGFTGPLGWIFSLRPMILTGRVSYGTYVYHNFMPGLWRALAPHLHVTDNSALGAVAPYALTILATVLSWTLLERPLQNRRLRI
jgi:peptidoglycan/LPS O-acetylase OafA/YrhL